MMNLEIGDTVGDYQILGELGAGGMGAVYRVRNLISDRIDAMKVLRADLSGDAELSERFLREIKVHASLVHPNIASLLTAMRHGDAYLMIMELVEGRSLEAAIANGPLDAITGVDVIRQVLAALSYAHGRGVIHRDIKPANIILRDDGVVKVTDFGIARSQVEARLTATGSLVGSLYYMSPEQVRALPVDARSDLYSVGVTLYEVLTRRRPFEGTSEYQIMHGHLEGVPAPVEQFAAGIPPEVSDAIRRALAKDPAHRFQTADEFSAALGAPRPMAPQRHRLSDRTTTLLPRVSVPSATAALPADMTAMQAVIQAKLLPYLGPITPRLVAKAASHAASPETLIKELAGYIPDARDRDAFLKACKSSVGGTGGGRLSPVTPAPGEKSQPVIWDAEYLAKVKQLLARYIGPIAGMLVDRASKQARSRQELCEALAGQIPVEQDRRKFLGAVPR